MQGIVQFAHFKSTPTWYLVLSGYLLRTGTMSTYPLYDLSELVLLTIGTGDRIRRLPNKFFDVGHEYKDSVLNQSPFSRFSQNLKRI